MTYHTRSKTLKALMAATDELAPPSSVDDWRLYDLAHDVIIGYTYGLPCTLPDASHVAQLMRTVRHPDLEVWEQIATEIIRERMI